MKFLFQRRLLSSIVILLTALAIGCGEDDDDVDNDHNGDHGDVISQIDELELLDHNDDDAVLAYVHIDDDPHWHGAPLILEVNEEPMALGFRFLDAEGEELDIPLGSNGQMIALSIADGSLAEIDVDTGHDDHVYLIGREAGDTELNIELRDHEEILFAAPALSLLVVDETDNGEEDVVSDFALLDRGHSPHLEIADTHGDHWDGDFADGITLQATDAEVVVGESDWYSSDRGPASDEPIAVSLGAEVLDDEGVELNLGGPFRLEAEHAHSEDEAYLYISHSHGDHVHFVGIGEGHAHVVFQVVSEANDDVIYTSPEFEFDIHDHSH